MVQKSRGDTADILQTVRLQRELYSRPELSRVNCGKSLVEWSDKFIQAYQARKAGDDDYVKLVQMSIGCYKETTQSRVGQKLGLAPSIAEMRQSLNNPAGLQKAHRNYLLRLMHGIGPK